MILSKLFLVSVTKKLDQLNETDKEVKSDRLGMPVGADKGK